MWLILYFTIFCYAVSWGIYLILRAIGFGVDRNMYFNISFVTSVIILIGFLAAYSFFVGNRETNGSNKKQD